MDNPLAQRINDSIRTTLSGVLFMLDPEEDSTKNLEQLADQFVKSYTDFLAEAPDYEIGWYIEVSHEVHFNSPKLTALELMGSPFTGGAHPIGSSETYNFFLPGGEPLKLDSLITDRAGFMQLLEKEFKLNRGLPETANLQEEGFFYDQAFALPGNYVSCRRTLPDIQRLRGGPVRRAHRVFDPLRQTQRIVEFGPGFIGFFKSNV